MLQRIQTIFLGMIPIMLGIMQFLPIWSKVEPGTLHTYTLYAWKLQELDPTDNLLNIRLMPYLTLGMITILISMLAIYEMLQYHNRTLQLHLGTINSICSTALMGTIVCFCTKNQQALLPSIKGHYQVGFYISILVVGCNLLANYFIRKDERLVQSTNRIR